MTVNHDVVGSSPTAGVIRPQSLTVAFFIEKNSISIGKNGSLEEFPEPIFLLKMVNEKVFV